LTALDSTVAGKAATNQTMYVGTTALAINRSSASLALTGVSIDGNAGTVTNGVYTSTTSLPNVTSVNSTTIPASATLLTDASTIAVAKGGTGATATTGTAGSSVLSISPALTGTPTVPTAAVDTNSTQIASTAFVLGQASATTPVMDGTAAVGTSTRYARADHVHNSDTSKASLAASNTFTTGTQIIATGADATVGLRVKRNSATQSANILEVTQSDGSTVLAKIDSAGAITAPNITDTALSTAGIVTNTSAGLLGTTSLVPIANGGTGHIYGSPLVGKAMLYQSYTKASNDTVPEAIFRNAAGTIQYFNVDADTSYMVEGVIAVSQVSATSAALRMSLIYYSGSSGSTTLTEQTCAIRYSSNFSISTYNSFTSGTAANTNYDLPFSSPSSFSHHVLFRAFIRTNATTAGRINVGATQTVVGATAPIFGSGSHLSIYKIGTGLVQTLGNWS
jgi:hypothetical protein